MVVHAHPLKKSRPLNNKFRLSSETCADAPQLRYSVVQYLSLGMFASVQV